MGEAELSLLQRVGAPEDRTLSTQSNLASTYCVLDRLEEALSMRRDVYSRCVRVFGEECHETLEEANNLAISLKQLSRYAEAKALLRKTMPVARRVLGGSHDLSLMMRSIYAWALYEDPAATLDNLREAVEVLEETTRTARRVLGGAHPLAEAIERTLGDARAALRALETQCS